MTGLGRGQLAGAALPEFLSAADAAAMQAMLAGVIETGRSEALGNRLRRADGSSRWVSLSASRITKERLAYVVGRDVTERRASSSSAVARTAASFRPRSA